MADLRKLLHNSFSSGGILVASLMLTNFLNFLFNAILGRELTLEQFSILTLVNTLWFILTVFFTSLSSTVNNRTAYLLAKRGENVAIGFEKFFLSRGLKIGLALLCIWLVSIPVMSVIFHIDNYFIFLSIAPAIIFGIYAAIHRGFFSGIFSFTKAAIIIISESLSKLLFALLFLALGLNEFVYFSIPLAIFITFLVTYFLIKKVLAHFY